MLLNDKEINVEIKGKEISEKDISSFNGDRKKRKKGIFKRKYVF